MTKTKIKIAIGIMLISAILQSRSAISLVLSSISQAFPEKSIESVQLIFSIMTGVGVIGAILAGKVASITTKKNTVIIFSFLTLGGSLLGYFANNSYIALLISSIIIGIGIGTLTPISSALIAEHYSGSQRASVMGIQSLAVNGGGILITLLAGYLIRTSWANIYLVFLLTIIVIIASILLLPTGIIEKPVEGEKVKVINPTLLKLLAQSFVFGICFLTFSGNIAFVVEGLENVDAAWASYAMSIFMGGAVLAGLLLPVAMKKLKGFTMSFGLLLACVGLMLLSFTASIPLIAISALLFGLGFGLYMPGAFTIIPERVHPAAATMAMSLFVAINTLGSMVNPYIITFFAKFIDNRVYTRYLLSFILLLAVTLITMSLDKKNKTVKVEE